MSGVSQGPKEQIVEGLRKSLILQRGKLVKWLVPCHITLSLISTVWIVGAVSIFRIVQTKREEENNCSFDDGISGFGVR